MDAPKNPRLFYEGYESSSIDGASGRPKLATEITLRDLFAITALAGAIAKESDTYSRESIAQRAYLMADEMLAARAKP